MGLVRKQAPREPEEALSEEPSTETLIGQLDDPDPDSRREAARCLDGVAAAVPNLLVRVGVEDDPRVLESILTTLAAHDTEEIAGSLAVHLATDEAGLRTA